MIGKFQTLHYFFDHSRADNLMTVKSILLLADIASRLDYSLSFRFRLADVVEERGNTYLKRPLFIRRVLQRIEPMVPHIICMLSGLLTTYSLFEFRNYIFQQIKFLQHSNAGRRIWRHYYFHKFIPY